MKNINKNIQFTEVLKPKDIIFPECFPVFGTG